MKDKKQTTLYLCLCLTCLANYNPVVAKTPVNMGILPTYVHSNKIESAPSLQDKKEGTIVGKITDKSGEPIVGATIKVKGSSVGTVSDVQGNYRLQAPSNAVIQFSFMGYTSKEQHVKGRSTINVVLEEDSKVLDELVVIGYGTVKKRSITGSVDQVKKN